MLFNETCKVPCSLDMWRATDRELPRLEISKSYSFKIQERAFLLELETDVKYQSN